MTCLVSSGTGLLLLSSVTDISEYRKFKKGGGSSVALVKEHGEPRHGAGLRKMYAL